MITIVCTDCKRLVQHDGTPYQPQDIWDAALALGWSLRPVVTNRAGRVHRYACVCPRCVEASK